MLPKSDIKADTCDLEGATYTCESGAPKGHYLFSQKHRVRSIRRVVTALLNEAAHWREKATKPCRKNGTHISKTKKGAVFPLLLKHGGFHTEDFDE